MYRMRQKENLKQMEKELKELKNKQPLTSHEVTITKRHTPQPVVYTLDSEDDYIQLINELLLTLKEVHAILDYQLE